MRTKTIYGGLLLLTFAGLASCSDENNGLTPPSYQDNGAIRFAAQTSPLTRAGETTTGSLNEFSVYAYTNGQPFMSDITVSKSSDNTWTYSPVEYWPATPVNFYAFNPINWGENSIDPSLPLDYWDQYGNVDLIYSVLMNQTQSPLPVTFNFRHALSQVNVNLRTDNPAISIRITSVTLHNFLTKGSFSFPMQSTSAGSTAQGTWINLSGAGTYILYMAGTMDDRMTLTSTSQSANEISYGFVLPQSLENVSLNATGPTGQWIEIDCIIYDAETGNQLWPNPQTPPAQSVTEGGIQRGRLFFPAITDAVQSWQAGTRYLYTISINQPAGLQEIEFGNPTVENMTQVDVIPEGYGQ